MEESGRGGGDVWGASPYKNRDQTRTVQKAPPPLPQKVATAAFSTPLRRTRRSGEIAAGAVPERPLLRGDASRMLRASAALVLGTTLLCLSQWMSDVGAGEYRPGLSPMGGVGAKAV